MSAVAFKQNPQASWQMVFLSEGVEAANDLQEKKKKKWLGVYEKTKKLLSSSTQELYKFLQQAIASLPQSQMKDHQSLIFSFLVPANDCRIFRCIYLL